jgi:hypothetical protein
VTCAHLNGIDLSVYLSSNRAKTLRGVVKAKAKGKPGRLPAEIKHRGPSGSRVVITTTARQTMADVVSDLEAIVARLRESMGATQDAA